MTTDFRFILLVLGIILFSLKPLSAQQENSNDANLANQYMNRYSIESLVASFDSPERAEWQQPEEVMALFGELGALRIMDLGAGSGYFTLRLAARGARVIAADVSDDFQEIIKEKLEKEEFQPLSDHIELRKVAYDNPCLQREEVDGILIVNTWHHIDNRRTYMQKALEGVSKKGKIIIVDFKLGVPGGPPDSHRLALKDAVEELEGLSYQTMEIDSLLLPRQYVLILIK